MFLDRLSRECLKGKGGRGLRVTSRTASAACRGCAQVAMLEDRVVSAGRDGGARLWRVDGKELVPQCAAARVSRGTHRDTRLVRSAGASRPKGFSMT